MFFVLDEIEVNKSDHIPDVMMTSIYQPSASAENNGNGHMNGAEAAASTLKCLEEPSFEFEASKEVNDVKKPSYRVLEDPFEVVNKPKAPSYRVLEDPMTTAMYDPTTSSEAMASNRPMASEVLEGAREKFDKIWGPSSKKTPQPPASDPNNEP